MIHIFLDSSIIIESIKKNEEALKILKYIYIKLENIQLYINPIVWSEVTYQLVIKRKFDSNKIYEMLDNFNILKIDQNSIDISKKLINQYNLYTNDSLNIASAVQFNINIFCSLDNDFLEVTHKENIFLINNLQKIQSII